MSFMAETQSFKDACRKGLLDIIEKYSETIPELREFTERSKINPNDPYIMELWLKAAAQLPSDILSEIADFGIRSMLGASSEPEGATAVKKFYTQNRGAIEMAGNLIPIPKDYKLPQEVITRFDHIFNEYPHM